MPQNPKAQKKSNDEPCMEGKAKTRNETACQLDEPRGCAPFNNPENPPGNKHNTHPTHLLLGKPLKPLIPFPINFWGQKAN